MDKTLTEIKCDSVYRNYFLSGLYSVFVALLSHKVCSQQLIIHNLIFERSHFLAEASAWSYDLGPINKSFSPEVWNYKKWIKDSRIERRYSWWWWCEKSSVSCQRSVLIVAALETSSWTESFLCSWLSFSRLYFCCFPNLVTQFFPNSVCYLLAF